MRSYFISTILGYTDLTVADDGTLLGADGPQAKLAERYIGFPISAFKTALKRRHKGGVRVQSYRR